MSRPKFPASDIGNISTYFLMLNPPGRRRRSTILLATLRLTGPIPTSSPSSASPALKALKYIVPVAKWRLGQIGIAGIVDVEAPGTGTRALGAARIAKMERRHVKILTRTENRTCEERSM